MLATPAAFADEVDACHDLALAQWQAEDPGVRDIAMDRHVVNLQYVATSVGSQPVKLIASGVGILKRDDGDTVIRWLCLLEAFDKPLFVHVEPR